MLLEALGAEELGADRRFDGGVRLVEEAPRVVAESPPAGRGAVLNASDDAAQAQCEHDRKRTRA